MAAGDCSQVRCPGILRIIPELRSLMPPLLSRHPFSSSSSLPPQTPRWLGMALVLAVHLLLIGLLMAQRVLPLPSEAVTLMVNFIAPPKVDPPSTPKPAVKPEPKPSPQPPPRQLVAEAPPAQAAEAVAPLAPPIPSPPLPLAAPPAPLPSGPINLSGELSIACPERPAPAYPVMSRRLGETGKVILRVTLDESGKVAKAIVDRSSGFNRLDEAALNAVRNWRCTAAQRNGQASAASALQPFNFVLEGN